MRITISLFLVLASITVLSQRITFNDPDLSFSFKKPKGWQVYDNGYEVKVSPSAADSSSLFFSITYFEDAQPFGELNLGLKRSEEDVPVESIRLKIAGESVKMSKKVNNESIKSTYFFYKYGQRFEVISISPLDNDPKRDRQVDRAIKSIKVTQ